MDGVLGIRLRIGLAIKHAKNFVELRFDFVGLIRVGAGYFLQLLEVVLDFEIRELEPMGGGDYDDSFMALDDVFISEFDQCGEGNSGMRAIEHAGAIGEDRCIGELFFGGLFDDAIELLEDTDRLLSSLNAEVMILKNTPERTRKIQTMI
ncbi:MAG: hypothetical protein PHF14_06105 [Verrucomicrobiota bacterium]|nr:hypothetical protein [Verrucomicrobiota bacterium]